MKVLIIDDIESVRIAFVHALEEFGFEVDTWWPGCGREVMPSAKEADIILLDNDMGSGYIEGVELLREFNRNGITAKVMAITLNYGARQEMLSNGACHAFFKKDSAAIGVIAHWLKRNCQK